MQRAGRPLRHRGSMLRSCRGRPTSRCRRSRSSCPPATKNVSIERCVRSLLAAEWVDFEVIVVDDRSTDATPQILARLAREDARLRVVSGEEMPAGWIGKPWALAQGERRASGEWLLFTDADSLHQPRGAASLLWLATRARIDAVSIATRQELGTFWERAALPSILGNVAIPRLWKPSRACWRASRPLRGAWAARHSRVASRSCNRSGPRSSLRSSRTRPCGSWAVAACNGAAVRITLQIPKSGKSFRRCVPRLQSRTMRRHAARPNLNWLKCRPTRHLA